MAVEVDRDVRPEALTRPGDELGDALRPGDSDRVDHDHLSRARLHRSGVRGVVEVRLGAGGVDAEVRDVDPALDRVGHGRADPLQHRLPGDPKRTELQLRDRRLDHARRDAKLDQRLDVGLHRAREAPDLGGEARLRDQPHGLPVVLGDPREPGLDALDARLGERAGDLELLLRHQHDADRLLTVAERRVVEADFGLQRVRPVELAGPDHRTIPSGNGDSFSAPSAVIRKLSSRRKPPPSSQ